MLHLINQLTMKEHVHILQAKFILRSIYLPDDTLVSLFLPHLRPSSSHSHWYKLSENPIWQRYTAFVEDDTYDSRAFTRSCNNYLENNFNNRRNGANSTLLSACRPTLGVDPILWLPMSNAEHSRLVRWRLGWLPGGAPKPCIYHPQSMFTKETCHMVSSHAPMSPDATNRIRSRVLSVEQTAKQKIEVQNNPFRLCNSYLFCLDSLMVQSMPAPL